MPRQQSLSDIPVRVVDVMPADAFIMVGSYEVLLYSGGVIHTLTPQEYAAHVDRCWRQITKGNKA
jgi:hypothetical protein